MHLLLPFFFLRLWVSGLRDSGYWRHWSHRLGRWRPPSAQQPCIVVHAVSVGEARSAEPLLRQLASDFPRYQLLLTTTTPSGLRIAKDIDLPGLLTAHLPIDIGWAVRPFLKSARPSLFILMENEVWPNLYRACYSAGIPVVIANARLSSKSGRRYALASALFQPLWEGLSLLAAQDRKAAKAYAGLGVPERVIHITGNLKYDALPTIPKKEAMKTRREWYAGRPVWLAASTHPGEEELMLQAHRYLSQKLKDPVLLLAPRHPWRCDAVEKLCRRHGYRSVARRSRPDGVNIRETSVMLIDTLGELSFFYAMADASFVGGSLVPHSGHNVLEPVAAGTQTVIGPHYSNFTTLVEQLSEAGLLSVVDHVDDLQEYLYRCLSRHSRQETSRQAADYIAAHRGAAERLCRLLRPLLEKE